MVSSVALGCCFDLIGFLRVFVSALGPPDVCMIVVAPPVLFVLRCQDLMVGGRVDSAVIQAHFFGSFFFVSSIVLVGGLVVSIVVLCYVYRGRLGR